ncbi:MAG TPA: hypothetical protein VGC08_05575 [Pedobacter sp.]
MNTNATILNLKKLISYVDWKLLLFLLLFLNVKFAIKIPAIALIYCLQFDFRFGFKLKDSRLPLFYLLIIPVGIIAAVLNKDVSSAHYGLVLSGGIFFWLLCILAVHQVKLSVERNDPLVIHRTILVFFIINALISSLNLGLIILEIKEVNPYTYQGQFQKYFIGTGDYIKGLTFDNSTTNAVLNAFGVIYFLKRKNALMLFICMIVLLLTGSNFINLAILFILGSLFIFSSTKDQKSLITVCLVFLVVFMAKVSPQNNSYVLETFRYMLHRKKAVEKPQAAAVRITERPDSTLNADEKKDKTATLYLDSIHRVNALTGIRKNIPVPDRSVVVTDAGRINIPSADINSAAYQSLLSTPPEQRQLLGFIKSHQTVLPISGKSGQWTPMPGKIASMLQTVDFFRHHPGRMVFGEGPGNFSSKLAFRASGLGLTGGYPKKYTYINPDFLVNHLDLYLNFFSQRAGLHSLTNSPFSVYDQLLAEYGISGLLIFTVCYLGFFARHYKILTYGLPILVLTMAVLFVDYWFEQLSVLVFFELLLFLDIRESTVSNT